MLRQIMFLIVHVITNISDIFYILCCVVVAVRAGVALLTHVCTVIAAAVVNAARRQPSLSPVIGVAVHRRVVLAMQARNRKL